LLQVWQVGILQTIGSLLELKKKSGMVTVVIWVRSLPDIHTSSVLVLAIVCFWVTMFLALKTRVNAMFYAFLQNYNNVSYQKL
jgi:hypothetical protein